jgi:hypothetical protein
MAVMLRRPEVNSQRLIAPGKLRPVRVVAAVLPGIPDPGRRLREGNSLSLEEE